MIRTPKFWQQTGVLPNLLSPLARLNGMIGRARWHRAKPWEAPIPVICIGNLTAGGSGKTPTALMTARCLIRFAKAPHFLTRGYGGALRGPVRVNRKIHSAHEVGDEALLLAKLAPTWVSRDRIAGAKAIAEAGANVIVMDDGYQNPSLAKNLSILVIDQGYGFGNGRLIPAGPLRETPDDGFARADLIVAIHSGGEAPVKLDFPANLPIFEARIVPTLSSERFTGQRLFGFAGIGRPEKFAATLTDLGVDLVGFQSFADHHTYSEDEVMQIIEHAAKCDARAVTTEKDWVRLPALAREMVDVVEVDLVLAAEAGFVEMLKKEFARPND